MNKQQYIQIVKTVYKLSNQIHFDDEFIDILQQLNVVDEKYKKELDYYKIYPNYQQQYGSKKYLPIANEIKRLCNEYDDLIVSFYPISSNWSIFKDERKNGVYTTYHFNEINITDLISFNKKFELENETSYNELPDDKQIDDLENIEI